MALTSSPWFPAAGLLSQCLENLLFDPKVWLSSLEDDVAVQVSIQEETLHLIYRGILMHEGMQHSSQSQLCSVHLLDTQQLLQPLDSRWWFYSLVLLQGILLPLV